VIDAIVLAGGRGTRIEEVTRGVVPKPMLPVGDQPFLDCHLEWLRDEGVERVVLAVAHLGHVIQNHFGDRHRGMSLLYSDEGAEPLGTGGAIRHALSKLPAASAIVVTNGDTYFPVPLERLQEQHRARLADVTIALAEVADASRYGTVVTAPDGRIERFLEKAPHLAGPINGGVYCLDPRVLTNVETRSFSLERDLLQEAPGRISVFGHRHDRPFFDIGIPTDYHSFIRWHADRSLGPTNAS